jgi:hypothetical protein
MNLLKKHARSILRVGGAAAALALVLALASEASACPNCRESLADDPAGQGLASGFYYSILFMMSMPFVILGTLGTVFYRSVRRASSEQQSSGEVDSTPQA